MKKIFSKKNTIFILGVPFCWKIRLNNRNFSIQKLTNMSEFEQVVKEGTQSIGKKLRRFLLWGIFALFLVVLGYIFIYCNFTISKGTTSGTLTNITYKGILFKTYEGTLNTGAINLNTNLPTDKGTQSLGGWIFSVPDHDVAEKLDELQGQKVKLYYKKKVKAMPWQGKTNYMVYDVKKL
jgi:hypothetical protein